MGERGHRPDRAPSQAGYVLNRGRAPNRRLAQVADDVAQFVFTDLPDSYAARTGARTTSA